ncbi:LacI family transcriptional regulator [Plantibacter flavus]|uniref:LacI family DNA-binding transcriptional regulator n=1 Tax=Plantibacter flavus TaxID=150123 RepID=UPI003F145251
MRATVRDVATLAGVSPKTVSNVINGGVFVRPETRERVEAAVRELDYVPNLSARGLRNGRTGVIALAMPQLNTLYSAEMASAYIEAARDAGWVVQFEQTAAEPQRERELLSRARANLVDGLILNPVTIEQSALTEAGSLPPTVLVGEVQQTLVDQVWVDGVVASREMTEHLISQGARRIAIVGAPDGEAGTATGRLRREGYRQAVEAAGLAVDPRLELGCAAWEPGAAADAVAALVAEHGAPDAIFCFTDSMAIGAVSALHAAGLRVPEDVMVAGFDDIVDGRYSIPPITTVSFDKAAFASQAIGLLIDRMSDADAPQRVVAVPHRIVVRASTRRPA